MLEAGGTQPIQIETDDAPRGSSLLNEKNHSLDLDVKESLRAVIEKTTLEVLPAPDQYFTVRMLNAIHDTVADEGSDTSKTSIAPPTKRNEATRGVDLAFNVAGMAKAAGTDPVELAKGLTTSLLNIDAIQESHNTGPFVNIGFDYEQVAPVVFSEVTAYGDRYGHFRDGEPEVVIVDYSSPNVAKNMTVAHLRSTIIGQALMNLQRAAGNVAFGINHIGDWGTQFGNIIYQYEQELAVNGEEFSAELEDNPTATLMRIYRKFNDNKDEDPQSVEAAREIFLKLEQGDPELVELWDKFRTWSLVDFGPSYDRLGIEFDAIQGESFYEDRMTSVIEEAVERDVLRYNDDGAVIFPSQPLTDPVTGVTNSKIMFDKEGGPREEIILKPSGGTVYLTRDLAAIRYRSQELGADKVLYVIGKEQKEHCLMLVAMAEQLGYFALGNAVHVSFGHLNVEGRKMKSREGKVVLLNDLLDEVVGAADDSLIERYGPGAFEEVSRRETARQIGTSALIFNDLHQDREKDIEFNPDAAKTLEVGGSVYVQYTSSRLRRVTEKAGGVEPLEVVPDALSEDEKLIISEIARFPLVIAEAANANSPHKVASYLTQFCQTINNFYQDTQIIKADTKVEKIFRLHLVGAASQVIANAAGLLHIELPERM